MQYVLQLPTWTIGGQAVEVPFAAWSSAQARTLEVLEAIPAWSRPA